MRIVLVLLSLLLIAGCGNNGEPEPNDTSAEVQPGVPSEQPGAEYLTPIPKESAEELPKCADVWVVGSTLPADYAGCLIEGGGVDQGAKYSCTDGGGTLIGHNDEFFARLGGAVKAYGEDEADFSQELFEACKPN